MDSFSFACGNGRSDLLRDCRDTRLLVQWRRGTCRSLQVELLLLLLLFGCGRLVYCNFVFEPRNVECKCALYRLKDDQLRAVLRSAEAGVERIVIVRDGE